MEDQIIPELKREDTWFSYAHGDRCCPLWIGLWDPVQMAYSLLYFQGL